MEQNKKNNIQNLIESSFYYGVYSSLCKDTKDIEACEKLSASLFNSILILGQVITDIELLKEAIKGSLKKKIFVDEVYTSVYTDELKQFLEQCDANLTTEYLCHELMHGCAVHFTTPAVRNNIIASGKMSASNALISDEEYQTLSHASQKQYNYLSEEEKKKYGLDKILSIGFGLGKGISMGSITNYYWMHHTPESLSFLFGDIRTRDKEKAMLHVSERLIHLDEQEQKDVISATSKLWDRGVGDDLNLCAILIDRDELEYEKVTHWNYDPPKVVEIRPYAKGRLNDITSNEDSRYKYDIPLNALTFITVPSVLEMNKIIEKERTTNKAR